ncbi:hypothetical protein KO561_08145 [Radiobacillus kanasensis]|uniref:hypothetical protein n=1 Tax=Radiobacillus kanasensis TaxID=2844358 RepID=UPI001E4A49EF|nr:hypothetical protein [Radiobacillus kanasensis]UFU00891.1 hypothetical protein KO561_08145 [Radiobacillus kanasensis]
MKYVMEALRKREAEQKLPGIKLDIDYQLVTLHDAMIEENEEEKQKAIEKLKELRNQLIELSTPFEL